MGTKSGYKLFPLNSIERMEPSFEKGETRPEFSTHSVLVPGTVTSIHMFVGIPA